MKPATFLSACHATLWCGIVVLLLASCQHKPSAKGTDADTAAVQPRIVNIVHVCRHDDFRFEDSDSLFVATTRHHLEYLKQYGLTGTFLLQYDALVDPRYPALFKEHPESVAEIGTWWEFNQPHVEAAGLQWKGRFTWDSNANVGFSTGYTKEERTKLVDVYMQKFHDTFGRYPSAVGSWYIDAYTLSYMRQKYGIEVALICRDQVGTDGYTFWGGYWTGGYYPSKVNTYMPAQTKEGQIDVPVFRMLGSDPIHQYDNRLGDNGQGVVTLETISDLGGRNPEWVDYYFRAFVHDPCLGYAYAQAGQENAFPWDDVRKIMSASGKKIDAVQHGAKVGFGVQFPRIDSLRRAGLIRLESPTQTARWFKENYDLTPATSVSVLRDYKDGKDQTVWYNSRFYRANLMLSDGLFYFRDVHFFAEQVKSPYLDTPGTTSHFEFFTLPMVDGFRWKHELSDTIGLRPVVGSEGSYATPRLVWESVTDDQQQGSTSVLAKAETGGLYFKVTMYEDKIVIEGPQTPWTFVLRVPEAGKAPFRPQGEAASSLDAEFGGTAYRIDLQEGTFHASLKDGAFELALSPDDATGRIVIDCRVVK